MTLRLCPNANPCPEDQPLDNFSSEGDDTLDFISTFYSGTPPPLLHDWTATECGVTVVSQVSQLDADTQARAQAETCNFDHQNPGVQTFLNAPQTCCVPCPDGSLTCYTIPGGLFPSLTQQGADSLAYQVACDLVNRNKVCLGNLPSCTCVGNVYNAEIISPIPVTWTFVGGSLPPGLTIAFSNVIALISGTVAAPGQYTFQLKATSADGPYTIKTFTITALQITSTSLPAFTVGVPYSYQLQATGGSGNYLWKIAAGTLPLGLTLSNTGLISGIPS